jgi:hypothetical protein
MMLLFCFLFFLLQRSLNVVAFTSSYYNNQHRLSVPPPRHQIAVTAKAHPPQAQDVSDDGTSTSNGSSSNNGSSSINSSTAGDTQRRHFFTQMLASVAIPTTASTSAMIALPQVA